MLEEAKGLIEPKNQTLEYVQHRAEEFHARLINLAVEVSLFIDLTVNLYN